MLAGLSVNGMRSTYSRAGRRDALQLQLRDASRAYGDRARRGRDEPPSRVCRSHDVRLLCDDVSLHVHGVQQPSCDVPLIFVALYVLLLFSGLV